MAWFSVEAGAATFAGVISFISLIIALAALRRAKSSSREFAPEGVAHQLLTDRKSRHHTFRDLKHHLGGFTDDELRKILVRAGGIRLMADGQEAWGLLSRNRKYLRLDDAKETGATEQAVDGSGQQQTEEQEAKPQSEVNPAPDSSEPFERLRAEMIKLGGLECVRSSARTG